MAEALTVIQENYIDGLCGQIEGSVIDERMSGKVTRRWQFAEGKQRRVRLV